MKINWKKLIICILIPLAVGGISAFITKNGMKGFEKLDKFPLSPPSWLFPVAWSILFILMGIASYLVATSKKPNGRAIIFYGIQLFFNFMWSIIFFNSKAYLFAFIWIIALFVLIIITTLLFKKISKPAAYLMIPYILWVAFAAYLNFGVYYLN